MRYAWIVIESNMGADGWDDWCRANTERLNAATKGRRIVHISDRTAEVREPGREGLRPCLMFRILVEEPD